jgi:hypothetical protein
MQGVMISVNNPHKIESKISNDAEANNWTMARKQQQKNGQYRDVTSSLVVNWLVSD